MCIIFTNKLDDNFLRTLVKYDNVITAVHHSTEKFKLAVNVNEFLYWMRHSFDGFVVLQ